MKYWRNFFICSFIFVSMKGFCATALTVDDVAQRRNSCVVGNVPRLSEEDREALSPPEDLKGFHNNLTVAIVSALKLHRAGGFRVFPSVAAIGTLVSSVTYFGEEMLAPILPGTVPTILGFDAYGAGTCVGAVLMGGLAVRHSYACVEPIMYYADKFTPLSWFGSAITSSGSFLGTKVPLCGRFGHWISGAAATCTRKLTCGRCTLIRCGSTTKSWYNSLCGSAKRHLRDTFVDPTVYGLTHPLNSDGTLGVLGDEILSDEAFLIASHLVQRDADELRDLNSTLLISNAGLRNYASRIIGVIAQNNPTVGSIAHSIITHTGDVPTFDGYGN